MGATKQFRRRAAAESAFAAGRSIGVAMDVWLSGWQSPAQIIHKSETRLHSLFEHARALSPLYGRLYRDVPAGVVPRLADLPIVTKRMLMDDLAASLTVRDLPREEIDRFLAEAPVGSLLRDHYCVWTSSGTTGAPGIFLHDRDALAIYDALEMFRFRGFAAPAEMAARLLAGERFAMVAATGGHFAGVSMIERLRCTYPWLASQVRVLSLLQPLPALVRDLNALRPTMLATYPTAAEVLAGEKEAGRLRFSPAEIWTGGECLCAAVRARLERVFGCRVRNGYGSSEFLSIATECGHGAMHVNADWVVLEPVDADHRILDPGEASATTLLTNLANGVQPLLRYDLGDSITVLPAPCACGNLLPAIRVEGRHDDVLSLQARDGRAVALLPLVLETVLEEEALLHDFQVVQGGPERLVLRLGQGAADAAPRASAALRAYLCANGLANAQVEIADEPPQRDRTSGKLRRIIRASRSEAVVP